MASLITSSRVISAPASVYYLPDYITREEEQILVDKVLTAPRPKWVHLKNRRLQNWGGIVNEKGMIAEPLPTWLSDLCPRFQESRVFDGLDATHPLPNHCLVNEYLAGQGIMPHKDGPAYLPTVATVSLSSHCVLDFYKVPDENQDNDHGKGGATEKGLEPEFSLLIQPRSLLVLKEDVYNKYMHGIREVTSDDLRQGNILNLAEALPEGLQDSDPPQLERSTRISLTFRIVQKTLSAQRIFLRR